jgi:beta-galactosidase
MLKAAISSASGLLIILIFFSTCREKEYFAQRNLDFNQNWRFIEDSIDGAQKAQFDHQNWRLLDLPHDWSVEDFKIQDEEHRGPFVKNLPMGHDVGYMRGGTGWYRKEFVVDQSNAGKEVLLHFDGVMGEMELWVNGREAGSHVYGYTPFYFNITRFLNDAGQKNTIAIRVYKPNENSRWFTGAGIYRSVGISYLNPVHIGVWGIGIKTKMADATAASLEVEVKIDNTGDAEKLILVNALITGPGGETFQIDPENVHMLPGEGKNIVLRTTINDPVTWDTDRPELYSVKVSLRENGCEIDEFTQDFGIRTITYSAEAGLAINGKNVLLKGACLHHDNGLLGAAAFRRAEERKVEIMKANGYNAIRTSHNPPSKYFLEACDRLGMLVIDEAFDMWIKPKRKNDYHRHFEQWWKSDLEAMVLRDRNHPSNIMWSFGNEVQERADPAGVEIGKNCIAVIQEIDDTRPITQAVCGFWDNPGKVWDDSAPAFEILDISGYNYQWTEYESDHAKYPDRIMYGSETFPVEAFENWQMVEKHPYIIGDFVWTGMDYIGESGIGHSIYPNPEDQQVFLMPWPTYLAWCGDIDVTGNKKPQSYYRDVVWGESKLEIMVHEPDTAGHLEVTSKWGWPNELPSWSWEGHEGEILEVRVFSVFPNVRLELNGSVIGEKTISASDKLTAVFEVPYATGTLKAVAFHENEILAEKIIRTSGQPTSLQLKPDAIEITAGTGSLLFIQATALDENGNLSDKYQADAHVIVEGPGALIAAGNASPVLQGSFQDEHFSFYHGKALIIVRSTGAEGLIRVSLNAGDLKSEVLNIRATSK